jgi:hypothetical protein
MHISNVAEIGKKQHNGESTPSSFINAALNCVKQEQVTQNIRNKIIVLDLTMLIINTQFVTYGLEIEANSIRQIRTGNVPEDKERRETAFA